MNKTLIAAAAAAVTFVAAPAMAQDIDGYITLGATYIDASDVGADLGAATIRAGATYMTYFGVEGEASLGLVDDGPTGFKAEMNQEAAIYAVGHFPIGEQFELMARAGWGRSQYEFGGVQGTDSSFNYGVAGQLNIGEAQGIRVDWTRHDFEDVSLEADEFSLSYVRRF